MCRCNEELCHFQAFAIEYFSAAQCFVAAVLAASGAGLLVAGCCGFGFGRRTTLTNLRVSFLIWTRQSLASWPGRACGIRFAPCWKWVAPGVGRCLDWRRCWGKVRKLRNIVGPRLPGTGDLACPSSRNWEIFGITMTYGLPSHFLYALRRTRLLIYCCGAAGSGVACGWRWRGSRGSPNCCERCVRVKWLVFCRIRFPPMVVVNLRLSSAAGLHHDFGGEARPAPRCAGFLWLRQAFTPCCGIPRRNARARSAL